jgi:hypothetical protein
VNWIRSWRADPVVRALADRHYSRKTPGASQFSPPGRNLTLRTLNGRAAWVTSWPLLEYVAHQWGDCWTCTLFRNESRLLSSTLILEAMAATAAVFGEAPTGGFLTFVDERKVASPNPGYCFKVAGFEEVGRTKDRDLVALQLPAPALPPAEAALEFQLPLETA